MRKVLFLDIDGVLFLGVSRGDGIHGSDLFDKQCIESLNEILIRTECEIVITSTWQNDFTVGQLKEIFAANGIRSVPIGVSSMIDGGFVLSTNRADDIQKWLTTNDETGGLIWCAVDDTDLGNAIKNFVKCDPEIGLKGASIASEVIAILKARS